MCRFSREAAQAVTMQKVAFTADGSWPRMLGIRPIPPVASRYTGDRETPLARRHRPRVAHAARRSDVVGAYARIALLRPLDGKTVEFEAGYIRHLEWHQQAHDPWTWYGWSIWGGERYRWFVYATFGHSAAALDSAVAPAEDERDNVRNVAPHVEYVENGLYEFLPGLSRGTGVPQRPHASSSREWTWCLGRQRRSRRRSPPADQGCRERRCGSNGGG
jgi:hypothetical protein